MILSVSTLGGGWIAAIGLALFLSRTVTLEAVGDRLGVSPDRQRWLPLAFAGLVEPFVGGSRTSAVNAGIHAERCSSWKIR